MEAPSGASSRWGIHLAISGGVLAVSDPGILAGTERYGVVHIYRRHGNTFTEGADHTAVL